MTATSLALVGHASGRHNKHFAQTAISRCWGRPQRPLVGKSIRRRHGRYALTALTPTNSSLLRLASQRSPQTLRAILGLALTRPAATSSVRLSVNGGAAHKASPSARELSQRTNSPRTDNPIQRCGSRISPGSTCWSRRATAVVSARPATSPRTRPPSFQSPPCS